MLRTSYRKLSIKQESAKWPAPYDNLSFVLSVRSRLVKVARSTTSRSRHTGVARTSDTTGKGKPRTCRPRRGTERFLGMRVQLATFQHRSDVLVLLHVIARREIFFPRRPSPSSTKLPRSTLLFASRYPGGCAQWFFPGKNSIRHAICFEVYLVVGFRGGTMLPLLGSIAHLRSMPVSLPTSTFSFFVRLSSIPPCGRTSFSQLWMFRP